MAKEERLSKYTYKLLLIILKYIPFVGAFCYLASTISAYLGYNVEIFSYVCSISLIPWVYMLIPSFVFKFCVFHRLPLYYMIVIDSLNIYDYYKGIPLDNFKLLMVHCIITGIAILLIIYFYAKCHKKPTE